MWTTKNHVAYSKAYNSWRAYRDRHIFSYAVEKYGPYAEKLARMAFRDDIRYQDYFEDNGDGTTSFFIHTNMYGNVRVVMDTEDAPRFYEQKISIMEFNDRLYAITRAGRVGRLILGMGKEQTEFVKYTNLDTLDNRKSNLEIVESSNNRKMSRVRSDNRAGIKGISDANVCYRACWVDNDGNVRTKSFSKNKYGQEGALKLALSYRNAAYAKNGYIA